MGWVAEVGGDIPGWGRGRTGEGLAEYVKLDPILCVRLLESASMVWPHCGDFYSGYGDKWPLPTKRALAASQCMQQ